MTTLTLLRKEIRGVIKESVNEAITNELMRFRASLFPFASRHEQKDIEKRYGRPTRKIAKSIRVLL